MNIIDIRPAIDAGDIAFIRQAFRALVDFPHEERVQAGGPGHLSIALNHVAEALQKDVAIMPASTCAALEMTVGAAYAEGAHKALALRDRLTESYRKHLAGQMQRAI